MHLGKDIYGNDVNDFRLEKWKADALNNIEYAYLPFNGGRRPCLGREFSLASLPVVAATCFTDQLTEVLNS